MTPSGIGVVIVTYNSAHVLEQCLASIIPFGYPVVVVDNKSGDDTLPIASRFPVSVIANSVNRGFSAAVNQGFAALETEYVLLLNPDLRLIASPAPLVSEFQSADVAAVAALLLDQSGEPQCRFQLRRLPSPMTLIFENLGFNRYLASNSVNRRYRYHGESWDAARDVEQPAGAFLLIRRCVWQSIGCFDERFWPLWFEDVDFCLRLRNAGYRIRFAPDPIGVHLGGHSVHRLDPALRQLYWYRSLLDYAAKHFSAVWVQLVAGSVLIASAGKLVSTIFRPGQLFRCRQYGPVVVLALRTMIHGRPPSGGPQPG